MAEKQVEQSVLKYLKLLRTQKIHVDQAILFGSQATGNAHSSSDIDLAIVSSDFGQNRLQEAVRLKLMTLTINPDIAPRPYSVDELRKAKRGDFLFDEVLQKGRVIQTQP